MPCSVNLNLSKLRDGWEVTKGKELGARKISAVGVSLSWALFWSCTTVAKPGRQKAPLPGLDWDRFVLFFFRMPQYFMVQFPLLATRGCCGFLA